MTDINNEPLAQSDGNKRMTAKIIQHCLANLMDAVREVESELTFTVQHPKRSPSPDGCAKIVKALSAVSSNTGLLTLYVASVLREDINEGDK